MTGLVRGFLLSGPSQDPKREPHPFDSHCLMVSPLSVAGEYTAEIAEFAEALLEFSAVLAVSAVHCCCDLFDNT
jgi:hypothetical protein